jgi:putative transposase
MVWRRAAHSAYDTAYHLVWSPKYRKGLLTGALAKRVEELFREIGEAHDITIEEMEVSVDHVHIFCSFPPRYAISQIVGRLKSLSARAIFKEFPSVKRKLWGGELWEDGYFVRTVGDKVTAEVIRQYIRRHKEEPDSQLKLF